ncbi:MAG: glutathione peroxidase [Bacteroidales bacterium]|nr:glutathione peroxidase [Bacteroidales bacterium]MCF8350941.1 glutathione peroxidase [Bacteroidales bacterium]MCF8376560.1 glutathione peroxidase [Bacteroidales bacterium]MCF8400588.1 glutathione peroxidase [Bacteroidales bacterium]
MNNLKTIISMILITTLAGAGAQDKNFHNFIVEDISGNDYDLSQLQGKKVLVVNTASKCGLTPQYEDLQSLYEKYKEQDFMIVGFPANNFMNQEPGTDDEIAEFCQANYGISFPMMSKISVKGDDMHPLYLWLTSKDQNGVLDAEVSWNFQKFMIDEEGNLVGYADPKTKPFDEKIVDWIEK